jgi:diguanylate cyclase
LVGRAAAEAARLAVLRSCAVLDTPAERSFDDVARLAGSLFGTPIALVSLVDDDRQWFKARVGLEVAETPRCDAFCAWAIAEPDIDVFVVSDATADPRFARNPLVSDEPRIRFYAGAPIRIGGGYAVGTLCVIDTVARADLTVTERSTLAVLARQIGLQLELRLAAHATRVAEARASALVEHASDVVLVLAEDATIRFAGGACLSVLGREPAMAVGTNALELVHPDDMEVVSGSFVRTTASPGLNVPLEFRAARRDGTWVPVEAVANNRLNDPAVRGVVVHLRDVRFRKEVDERVVRGEQALADAQRVARMGSWEWDLVTGDMVWSQGMYRLFGLDPRVTAPTVDAWWATAHPDERAEISARLEVAKLDGAPFTLRRQVLRADGETLVCQLHAEVDGDPAGRAIRMRGSLVDVSALARIESTLIAERHFLRAVLDSLDEGVVACDEEGLLTVFNPAAEHFHGMSAAAVPPEEWASHYDLYEADGVRLLRTDDIPLFRALRRGRVDGDEIVIAPRGGTRRLVRCSGRAINGADGTSIGAVVAMHDITRQRRAEDTLRRLAHRDALTGLLNRSALTEELNRALEERSALAVLFIDLDGFKSINDEHGHHVGDRVLQIIAARLEGGVKTTDIAARLGGDEFVVLCREVGDEAQAASIVSRLRRELTEPIRIGDLELVVGASVGLAHADATARDGDALLARADRAMYADKGGAHRRGRDRGRTSR